MSDLCFSFPEQISVDLAVDSSIDSPAMRVNPSPSGFLRITAGSTPDHPPATSTTNRKGGQEWNLEISKAG